MEESTQVFGQIFAVILSRELPLRRALKIEWEGPWNFDLKTSASHFGSLLVLLLLPSASVEAAPQLYHHHQWPKEPKGA